MKNKNSRTLRRRLRSSYATSVISISLVLCLLGTIGILLLTAQRISRYVKENVGFTVFLKDGVKTADVYQLQKMLDAQAYVRSTRIIDKDEAAREFTTEFGRDFVGFLGYNPLLASIELKLDAAYANNDSLARIEQQLLTHPEVKEVAYQRSMIHALNDNMERISLFVFAFSVLLFVVSVALINNTIRLAVYSRRMSIRTMQLVGATNSFIRRPFLWHSAFYGMVSAVCATAILVAGLYQIQGQLNNIISINDMQIMGGIFLLVLTLGIVLSVVSTYFAVNKFLRIRTEKLY